MIILILKYLNNYIALKIISKCINTYIARIKKKIQYHKKFFRKIFFSSKNIRFNKVSCENSSTQEFKLTLDGYAMKRINNF